MIHISKWSLASSALAIAGLLCSTNVSAQEELPPEQATVGLQDIIITATRRDSRLQTTPIAVSAVDQALIQQASPRNLGDLASFVPNFSAATIAGFNAASFSIRGVGQNNIISYFEPPVAVLVDDFVVPSVQTQLLDTFDIDQVEVLRGPQGTLFGKNTTGGAVVVRTKRPEIDKFDLEGRLQAGSFGTVKLHGAVNIPLSDTLAFRGVLGSEQSDGYYRFGACYGPIVANVPSKFAGLSGCGDGRHLGGTDIWNGRAKLLWEPSDSFDALLQYEGLRDRSDVVPIVSETPASNNFLMHRLGLGSASFIHDDPLDNAGISRRSGFLIDEPKGARVSVDGLYLNANLNTAFGTFTSVSGIRGQRSHLPNSFPGQGPIAADGEILSLFDVARSERRETLQQELRFASDLGGAFDFVVGGFYQKDKIDFCVAQIQGFLDLIAGPTPFGPRNTTPFILCNAQRARAAAAFVEGTFEVTPRFKLTAGVRYSWEKKHWYGRQQVFIPQLDGGTDLTIRIDDALDANVFDHPAGVMRIDASSNEPTWRLSAAWEATDEIFAYATYSRGFKSGGFNDQIGSSHQFRLPNGQDDVAAFREAASPTAPEKADSYEIGVKTNLFDRRLRFNLAGFYVEYSDLQKQIAVPIIVGGQPNQVTRFFNAASATVKGIEAEATAAPFTGLTLRGTLGYQKGEYDEYVTPIPAGYDLAISQLDRLPEWQASVDGTYAVPIGNFEMTLNGNVSYVSRNLFTQSIVRESDNTFLDARTLFNASLTLAQADNRYYARLVGRNLTDNRYRSASQVAGGLWKQSQFGPPRYLGIELGVRFGE